MPYEVRGNCLFKWVASGKSAKDILLCNFLPYLISEKVYDDGNEQKRYFEVGAVFEDGSELTPLTLSVAEFEAMNWVTTKWGAKCNIEAGRATKDHIRHAIQSTGLEIVPQIIYSHSGFREINHKLKFLLSGMETSCETNDSTLKNYYFPNEIVESKISSSYELLKSGLAPNKIIFPLTAFMYLAPLTHLLRKANYPPKSVLMLIGRTGAKKSSLSALMLSHFGNFTHSTLPLTFRDTGNSIIERLFTLKDLPVVIDDFHPTNGGYEESAMLKTMQLIMRAFGDGTARASLNQKRELKEAKPPRGIGLITAEYPPNISESGIARSVAVNISPTDIDIDKLTEWQLKAEQEYLSTSMKSYILWLESQLNTSEKQEKFVSELKILFEVFREMVRDRLKQANISFHDRTPEGVTFLLVAFEYFTNFLCDKNIIDYSENKNLSEEMFEICIELCTNQSESLKTVSISEKFIENILLMIENEDVFIIPKESFNCVQNGCTGFYDEDFFYLNMTATIKSLRKFCLEQGEPMPPSVNILLKHLDEDGILILNSTNGRTHSIKLSNGKNIRVAKLKREKFCVESAS